MLINRLFLAKGAISCIDLKLGLHENFDLSACLVVIFEG